MGLVPRRLGWGTSSCFNPRAHAGRDCHSFRLFYFFYCFNPRAHAGRDAGLGCLPRNIKFQSTRPRGARLAQRLRWHTN